MQHLIESPRAVAGVLAIAQPGDTIYVDGGTKAAPIVFPPPRGTGRPLIHMRRGVVVLENDGRVQMSGGELVATNAQVNILGGKAELRGCVGEVGSRADILARHCRLNATGFARVEVVDDPDSGMDASRIQASEQAHVRARAGRVVIEPRDAATIEAFEDALVEDTGFSFRGTITLHDRSRLTWKRGAQFERLTLNVLDDAVASLAVADGARLTARGRGRVYVAVGRAELELREAAQATVGRGVVVRAYDRTRVVAKGKGTVVELHDDATAEADYDVQVRDERIRAGAGR